MKRPAIDTGCFLLIDQQERLVPVMDRKEKTTSRQAVMLQGAAALELDVIVTEQYPKGLGPTLPELRALLPPTAATIGKTAFSAFGEPAFRSALKRKRRTDLFIAGIESHICVLQTVWDALADGYRVWALADAVTSRHADDRELALQAMRHAGATVLPVEAALFLLLENARHPAFKTVSALIK